MDLLTRAFYDYRMSQRVDGSHGYHSRLPFQSQKRNHFRNFSDQRRRNLKNFHSYARFFQQTRDSQSYSPGYREKRRHHITSDGWKRAKFQSHTNKIITLLPKPKMVWIQVDSSTHRKLHNPQVITKGEFVGT